MKRTELRLQRHLSHLLCDRCGREAERDGVDGEFHEFASIKFRAGYGSVFCDGKDVEVDLCQHCLKDTLVAWIRVTDPHNGFGPDHHSGEFPNESERRFIVGEHTATADMSIENDDGAVK